MLGSARSRLTVIVITLFGLLVVPLSISKAAAVVVVQDSFDRQVATGWGIADKGGTWIQDTAALSSVKDGHGLAVVPKVGNRSAYLPSNVTGNHEAQATFGFPTLPTAGAGVRGGLTVKRLGDTYYLAGVRVNPKGNAFLSLHAVSSPFFAAKLALDVPLARVQAGGAVVVKVAVTEGAQGLVAAKAWPVGGAEPADWQIAGNSSSITEEGKIGVRFDATSGTGISQAWVDDLSATQNTEEPEANAPTAAFTSQTLARLVKVDASTSADVDGTIASYQWSYGDGTTATGVSPEAHLYEEPGDYTVTLTVTDNSGLTGTFTDTVTASPYEKPDASTTGVPDGTSLTTLAAGNIPYPDDAISGNKLIINTPGAVYDGFRFQHLVEVRSPGVTFRNSLFEGLTDNPPDTALLLVNDTNTSDSKVASVDVTDSSFIPRVPSVTIDGIRGSNISLRGVEITKTVDGVHIYGPTKDRDDPNAGNLRVERSWIHDLVYYADDPNHSDGTHNDGIQIRGGSDITIIGSRLDGSMRNAAIQVTQAYNDVANLVVVGNYLSNGLCTVNIDDTKGSSAIPNVFISVNVFDRGSTYYKDCADIITDRTAAITTARFDYWDDLSSPPPIAIDSGRSAGWRFLEDRPVNPTWPTDPDWNRQFGDDAPPPATED